MKNIRVFVWKISVFGGEIFYVFEQACFRNVQADTEDSAKTVRMQRLIKVVGRTCPKAQFPMLLLLQVDQWFSLIK